MGKLFVGLLRIGGRQLELGYILQCQMCQYRLPVTIYSTMLDGYGIQVFRQWNKRANQENPIWTKTLSVIAQGGHLWLVICRIMYPETVS